MYLDDNFTLQLKATQYMLLYIRTYENTLSVTET